MLPCTLHNSAVETQTTSFVLRLKSFESHLGRTIVQIWNRFHLPSLVTRRRHRGAQSRGEWTVTLLKWALLFFVISIVAGILGFTGISAASADVARILFYIFLVIFLVLLILGLTIFRV
jgi:uncharacterized membrane protein YtjA (UPF0391 family)